MRTRAFAASHAARSFVACAVHMSDATSNLSKDEQFDELVSPTLDKQTVTNDAVAGETVTEGGEPNELEAQPQLPDNELSQEQIELDQG